MTDPINPSYYRRSIEVADFLDAYDLDRWEAQVVKYVVRARHKNGLEDYRKAEWYLRRIIARAIEVERQRALSGVADALREARDQSSMVPVDEKPAWVLAKTPRGGKRVAKKKSRVFVKRARKG